MSSKRWRRSRLSGSTIANSSSRPIVKSVEASNSSRVRGRSRWPAPSASSVRPLLIKILAPRPASNPFLELGARDSPYASGQVEVERVKEIDRWAGRVHGHVWRHLEQLLRVVEDDLHACANQPVSH